MVRLQTLDLRIGVRVPASQPNILKDFRLKPAERHSIRYPTVLLIVAENGRIQPVHGEFVNHAAMGVGRLRVPTARWNIRHSAQLHKLSFVWPRTVSQEGPPESDPGR